ncbi:MAG: hypothetical protein KF787_02045 [Phycisphaeraceae bacterium]|nr:hypothetical protein [Phycisphaeraceae bacterium]
MLHLVTSHDHVLVGDGSGRPGRSGRHGPRDSGCDSIALACRRAIELTAGIEHHVLAVGGSMVENRLRALGVPVADRIAPACGSTWIGRSMLHRYIRSRPYFDAVQAWCRLTRGMVPPSLPARQPPAIGRISEILATFQDGTIAPDATALRRLASGPRGLPVLLFAADPPDAGDAGALFRVIGLADKSGSRFAVVIPGGVRGVKRVARLHADLRLDCPIMLTDRSATEWIDAVDVALTVAVKDPRAAIIGSLANARGVPVVASPDGPMTLMEYYAPAAKQLRAILASANPACPPPTHQTASVAAWLVEHWLGHVPDPAPLAGA